MNFRIGQKVVCVKRGQWSVVLYGETVPEFGKIYTVRGFDPYLDAGGSAGIFLEEIVNPPHQYRNAYGEASFCVTKFRPVIERKTEVGMAILREILDRETVGDPAHVSKPAGVA